MRIVFPPHCRLRGFPRVQAPLGRRAGEVVIYTSRSFPHRANTPLNAQRYSQKTPPGCHRLAKAPRNFPRPGMDRRNFPRHGKTPRKDYIYNRVWLRLGNIRCRPVPPESPHPREKLPSNIGKFPTLKSRTPSEKGGNLFARISRPSSRRVLLAYRDHEKTPPCLLRRCPMSPL